MNGLMEGENPHVRICYPILIYWNIRNGAYLCNGSKRVEAPLNLKTLEEAVRQCPKLQQVAIDDVPFGDECFPILAQISKLNMLWLCCAAEKSRGTDWSC